MTLNIVRLTFLKLKSAGIWNDYHLNSVFWGARNCGFFQKFCPRDSLLWFVRKAAWSRMPFIISQLEVSSFVTCPLSCKHKDVTKADVNNVQHQLQSSHKKFSAWKDRKHKRRTLIPAISAPVYTHQWALTTASWHATQNCRILQQCCLLSQRSIPGNSCHTTGFEPCFPPIQCRNENWYHTDQ